MTAVRRDLGLPVGRQNVTRPTGTRDGGRPGRVGFALGQVAASSAVARPRLDDAGRPAASSYYLHEAGVEPVDEPPAVQPPRVGSHRPPPAQLSRLANLIEAAEESRTAAIEVVRVRHDVLRDAIIAEAAAREDG